MIGIGGLILLIVIINIVMIAILTFRAVIFARSRKIVTFLALFLIPVLAGIMGVSNHLERSKTTEFCLSCHVMKDYGQSLLLNDRVFIPALHYQNHLVEKQQACYICHTDYTIYGGINAKLRGFKHVYIQYFGVIPEKIKLYTPYTNRDCLHCHDGARSFEESTAHNIVKGRLIDIKTGRVSCLSSGCHDLNHNINQLKGSNFWKEVAKKPQ